MSGWISDGRASVEEVDRSVILEGKRGGGEIGQYSLKRH